MSIGTYNKLIINSKGREKMSILDELNEEQRKAATAKKIGTYPESHKCIRHYDDQIKFIYDWLGNASPGDKNGFRVPEVPTVMIVK